MKRVLALAMIAAVVTAACGAAAPTGGASASPAQVTLNDGKLVIGVINDQSLVYADLSGKNAVEAVKMAVEDFKAKYGENALGGPVEVITADHQNKPDLASSKAQEFYERNNADAIFDVPTSSAALAVAKVAQLKPQVLGAMQAGGDLVNVVKQYNEFKLKDQNIKLAIGLLFDTDITALGADAFAGVVYTTPWVWSMDDQSRQFADKFLKRTGIRPTFAHAGNYSAAWQYMEAIRRAGSDDADAVVKQLEGYKFSDFFIRNGLVRPEDHWVQHDALLAQVKPSSEAKEKFDYSKVLATIPAETASRPLADAGCKMPK